MLFYMKLFTNKIVLLATILLIGAVIISIYMWKGGEKNKKPSIEKKVVTLNEQDFKNQLPMTKKIIEGDTKKETIAYRLWFDLMEKFKTSGQLAGAYFNRFHLLEEKDKEFVVAAVFQLQLGEGVQTTSWKPQKNGLIDGLVWKLKIKKQSDQTYTLESFEKSSDKLIGLPPVQDMDSYKKEAGIKTDENSRYEIVDDTLKVTYNNGKDWNDVPIEVDRLFEGDYNGPKNELIEGSYVIHSKRTAFVIGGRGGLQLLISEDQGNSWDEVNITDKIQGARMRLLGFTSDQHGYLIATGYRTMASEGNYLFKTNDGGHSWKEAGSVAGVTSLVTDGGLINDELGFVSFGSINFENEPPRPCLYRTADGGKTWKEVKVPFPKEYKGIFTVAETPIFNGNKGTLLVNQGPNGDYLGGNVLVKFTTKDMGKTWTFAGLVDPDEVLGK